MGLMYSGYRKTMFWALEKAREKGIEVDKQRKKEEWSRKNKIYYDTIGIDWSGMNRHFEDSFENMLHDVEGGD